MKSKILLFIITIIILSGCAEIDRLFLTKIDKKISTNYVYEDGMVQYTYITRLKNQMDIHGTLHFVKTDADKKTFEVLSNDIGKDKNSVYFKGLKLPNSDPKTFKIINDPISKDNNQVYLGADIIEEADSDTFKVVHDYYFKDKESVFYMDELLPYIDAKTYKYISHSYFKDKNNVYIGKNIIETKGNETLTIDEDINTFKPIDECLSKTENAYYHGKYLFNILGIDVNVLTKNKIIYFDNEIQSYTDCDNIKLIHRAKYPLDNKIQLTDSDLLIGNTYIHDIFGNNYEFIKEYDSIDTLNIIDKKHEIISINNDYYISGKKKTKDQVNDLLLKLNKI